MARSPKPPADRASSAFRVRVTLAQRAAIDAKAKAAGVTKSELLRAAVLHYPLPPAPVTAVALRELRAIGVNLNQLTHRANATGRLGDQAALREALAQFKAALSRLLPTG